MWVYEKHTETELRFKPAPMGGYAGIGNYMKQWRKRHKKTQTEAAKMFELSQSFIAKIEKGERGLPERVFKEIRQDNLRDYGRQ